MFAFSLEAEVGGYRSWYLNREKIFLSPDRGGGGGRRKEVGGGKGGGGLAMTFSHPDSGTCRYENNTFPQMILAHYSYPLTLCISLYIDSFSGGCGRGKSTSTHTHACTLLLFSQEKSPPSLIFILCFLHRHARACPRPANLDRIQSKQT